MSTPSRLTPKGKNPPMGIDGTVEWWCAQLDDHTRQLLDDFQASGHSWCTKLFQYLYVRESTTTMTRRMAQVTEGLILHAAFVAAEAIMQRTLGNLLIEPGQGGVQGYNIAFQHLIDPNGNIVNTMYQTYGQDRQAARDTLVNYANYLIAESKRHVMRVLGESRAYGGASTQTGTTRTINFDPDPAIDNALYEGSGQAPPVTPQQQVTPVTPVPAFASGRTPGPTPTSRSPGPGKALADEWGVTWGTNALFGAPEAGTQTPLGGAAPSPPDPADAGTQTDSPDVDPVIAAQLTGMRIQEVINPGIPLFRMRSTCISTFQT